MQFLSLYYFTYSYFGDTIKESLDERTMVKNRTTYLTTTMSVSVHKTRDRAPTTSSSEGELLKTEGQRYSGDVPVWTIIASEVSIFIHREHGRDLADRWLATCVLAQ